MIRTRYDQRDIGSRQRRQHGLRVDRALIVDDDDTKVFDGEGYSLLFRPFDDELPV